jgi:hypothetical protein
MPTLGGEACIGFSDSTLPAFPQKSAAKPRKSNNPIGRPYQSVQGQSAPTGHFGQAAVPQNDSVVNIGRPRCKMGFRAEPAITEDGLSLGEARRLDSRHCPVVAAGRPRPRQAFAREGKAAACEAGGFSEVTRVCEGIRRGLRQLKRTRAPRRTILR